MNKEIIDKWLDEEYGVSYTRLEELHDWLVDKNIELQEKYTQALEVAQERFDRIQKAIDFIQDNYLFDIEYHEDGDFNRVSCKQQKKELLDILKGDNNG